MDEKHALQALRRRDETALAWFIEQYAPYVNTIIFHIIGGSMSSRDIEEVSSDVFLVLWKNAGKIRPGKVKAYLSGTARNMAKAKLREIGQELPLEEDVLMTSNADIEHDLEVREQARLVKQAMLNMEYPDREIFLRHYYYFQPLSVIAEEIGLNLSTVKTRLRRGRSKLQDAMKISDLLDVIEDDSVPIHEQEVIASERIMEVTMAKINTVASNNDNTRKKLSKGVIAAIIAAACLTLSVTAFATGLVSRVVNWQGETIGEVEEVSVTPPPPGSAEVDRFERTQSILDEAGSAELTLVKYTDENGVTDTKSTGLTQDFSSVEELSAALSANGSELQVFDAPAGYAFHSAQVTYDCAAGYEYTLVSRETDNSGLTVEKYSIPDEGVVISSYMIDYMDADGKSLFITGNLISTDVEFSVDENKTVEKITVDGMDSALIFEQTDVYGIVSASLEMSKTLSSPIPYVEKALLSGSYPTDDDVFKKIWYSVNAYDVDADTLMEMLAF